MSITITIMHNGDYAKEHNTYTTAALPCFDCQKRRVTNPACLRCQGKGFYERKVPQYVCNLYDDVFYTLWDALSFDPKPRGTMHPCAWLRHYTLFAPKLIEKAAQALALPGVQTPSHLLSRQNNRSRLQVLYKIAMEAARREEFIYWG